MPRHSGSMRSTRQLTDFSELAEELYPRPVRPYRTAQDTSLSAWELQALAEARPSRPDPRERPVLFLPTEADLMNVKYDEACNGFPRLNGGPFARNLGLV